MTDTFKNSRQIERLEHISLSVGEHASGRGASRRGDGVRRAWAMDRPSEGHEQQIAQWMRQGESRGFSLLMQHYGGRVTGYLRQRFPSLDDHAVHDVLADAMLALADSFDARRGSLAAWFLLLAHQRAVSRLRAERGQRAGETWTPEDEPVAASPTPLETLATHERLLEVEDVIAALSTLEQAVVRADVEEGRTVGADELATRLGTTAGSVYAARRRARRKLLVRCPWIAEMLGTGDPSNDQTT